VLNDWRERGEADQGVAMHPSGKAERLRENVHRALSRVLPGSRRQEEISWSSVFDSSGPPIDVEEGDDEIVVTAEMPGLEPELSPSPKRLGCHPRDDRRSVR
jgi:HSP20 family molecular chaperone IbpA